MRWQRFVVSGALVLVAAAAALAAQQAVATVEDDDITIRGCVRAADVRASVPTTMLVWTRGDIMLVGVTAGGTPPPNPVGTTGIAGRVFYWLDDDENLAKHIGQMVEIKGALKDLEIGDVEIDREGDFTEIELDLDGKKERARVPTAWLRGTGADRDQEFKIAARRIVVDDVRVLGACNLP
jgi:hypothetical protein